MTIYGNPGQTAQAYRWTWNGLIPAQTQHVDTVSVSEIADDLYGAHDAIPRGVPSGYSWRETADTDINVDYLGFNSYGAVNVWGQVFATDTTTAYTARLQARTPQLYFLSAAGWANAPFTAGSMGGAYYEGSFQGAVEGMPIRADAPGTYSFPLSGLSSGTYDASHYWWNGMFPRVAIPAGTTGILARQEMRLIDLVPGTNVIASTGVDEFATPETVVHPQGWNPGIPNPRMKWVTDQWQFFYGCTLSLDTLTNNPPTIRA